MGTAESPMTADDGSQDPGTWLFPRSLSPHAAPLSPARFQASCLRQHSGRHHLHRGGAGGAREPGGRNGGGPEERGRLVRARPSRSSLAGGARSRTPAPGPSAARAGPPYPPAPPPRWCMHAEPRACRASPPAPSVAGGRGGAPGAGGLPGPASARLVDPPAPPGVRCGAGARSRGGGALSEEGERRGGVRGGEEGGAPRGILHLSPCPISSSSGLRAPFGWPPRQWDARGGGGSSPNPKKKVVAPCALHAREEGTAGPGGSVPRSRRSAYLARALRGAPGAAAGCAGAWARRSGEADPGAGATAARWGRRGSW